MENREINEEFYNQMFRQTEEKSFFSTNRDQISQIPLNQTMYNDSKKDKFKRVRNTYSLNMKVDKDEIREKVKVYLKDQKMTPN